MKSLIERILGILHIDNINKQVGALIGTLACVAEKVDDLDRRLILAEVRAAKDSLLAPARQKHIVFKRGELPLPNRRTSTQEQIDSYLEAANAARVERRTSPPANAGAYFVSHGITIDNTQAYDCGAKRERRKHPTDTSGYLVFSGGRDFPYGFKWHPCRRNLVAPHRAHNERVQDKYDELIAAVRTVYRGESSHQTALRYIQAAEHRGGQCFDAYTTAGKNT